jgi:hypothetical protein
MRNPIHLPLRDPDLAAPAAILPAFKDLMAAFADLADGASHGDVIDSGHHVRSIRKLDTAEDRSDRRTEVEDFLILLVEQILRTNINLCVLSDVVVRDQIPHIE